MLLENYRKKDIMQIWILEYSKVGYIFEACDTKPSEAWIPFLIELLLVKPLLKYSQC